MIGCLKPPTLLYMNHDGHLNKHNWMFHRDVLKDKTKVTNIRKFLQYIYANF